MSPWRRFGERRAGDALDVGTALMAVRSTSG
jgi:hypothetical protein